MQRKYTVIPSLDVTDLDEAVRLAGAIGNPPFVNAFKVGFSLGLTCGLPEVVRRIREVSQRPIIYDHQKAGTDIPDTGALFARTLAKAGIQRAILFPQAGPRTLSAWISALRNEGVEIIVGAIMTHPAYVASEGGFLLDGAMERIFAIALEEGVTDFVVPLTKPDAVRELHRRVGFATDCEFFSPGYGAQGGDPSKFDFVSTHHLIIGRSLLKAENPAHYITEIEMRLQEA